MNYRKSILPCRIRCSYYEKHISQCQNIPKKNPGVHTDIHTIVCKKNILYPVEKTQIKSWVKSYFWAPKLSFYREHKKHYFSWNFVCQHKMFGGTFNIFSNALTIMRLDTLASQNSLSLDYGGSNSHQRLHVPAKNIPSVMSWYHDRNRMHFLFFHWLPALKYLTPMHVWQ